MSSVVAMKEMEKIMESYAKSYAETQIEIICGHYKIDVNEAKELMKKKRRKTKEWIEPEKKKSVEPKVEANVEGNMETKVEAKPKTKKEPKVEPKVKAKVEGNMETKVEAKPKTKKEPKAKTKKEKERKLEMEIELPFSGEIDEKRCQGIRTAGKLYTQCLTYTEEGVRYCKKCQKESEQNDTGKPNNGDMEDRKNVGLYEYKDKDGKNPWPYYKLMRKHGWSKEYVEEIGAKYGIKISEEHYNEEGMKKPVHQKGRPKKEKKKVEAVEEIMEAKEEVKEEAKEEVKEELELELEEEEVEEEEEEVEEEVVEQIEEGGKLYLRSKSSGLIYSAEDMSNPIVVGIWDRVREKIDLNYKESSEDEEEEEEEE